MSILNRIKKGVANSGSNKGKVIYIKADSKIRIRFLQEIEDGIVITNHDHFDDGINFFDQEMIKGERHELQDDEGLRHREAYVWSVWDYDAKEVKLFIGYANNFNPLPALIGMYEAYGTIMDRDYVIQRNGTGTKTSYSVVPMDKVKFKNSKAKPYAEKKLLDILDKAFPAPGSKDDDEDEDENPKKKGKGRKPNEEGPEDDDGDEDEYGEMSPKELYMECLERGLTAKKKQKKQYYIDILIADDQEDVEDDEDEDDEW